MKLTPVADIEIGDAVIIKHRGYAQTMLVLDVQNDLRATTLTLETEQGNPLVQSFPYDELLKVRAVAWPTS